MGNVAESNTLKYEPQSIDFGDLHSGTGASGKLNLNGGPGKVVVRSDQLKVSPIAFEYGESLIEIILSPGNSGELIWDELILQTDTKEYRVLITARWVEKTAETMQGKKPEPLITPITPIEKQKNETPTVPIEKPVKRFTEDRTFQGKSCWRCNKNFKYDENTGMWGKCTCTWYQMAWNITKQSVKEIRYGAKDIPSYLQELWRIILGKEKL